MQNAAIFTEKVPTVEVLEYLSEGIRLIKIGDGPWVAIGEQSKPANVLSLEAAICLQNNGFVEPAAVGLAASIIFKTCLPAEYKEMNPAQSSPQENS